MASEDLIREPEHYKGAVIAVDAGRVTFEGGRAYVEVECLEIIRALGLGFVLGNAFKYLYRHEKKGNPIGDLEKAAQYIAIEVEERRKRTTIPGDGRIYRVCPDGVARWQPPELGIRYAMR